MSNETQCLPSSVSSRQDTGVRTSRSHIGAMAKASPAGRGRDSVCWKRGDRHLRAQLRVGASAGTVRGQRAGLFSQEGRLGAERACVCTQHVCARVCMCAHMCMFIMCAHAHPHVCVPCVCAHMCLCSRVCACVNKPACSCMCARMPAHVHASAAVYASACVHTCACLCMCALCALCAYPCAAHTCL